MQNTYSGMRVGANVLVTCNNVVLPLPSGMVFLGKEPCFEWGCNTPGAMLLAIVILRHEMSEAMVIAWAPIFVSRILANLGDDWTLTTKQIVDFVISTTLEDLQRSR